MGQATSKVVGTYYRNRLTLSDLFAVILECSFVYLYTSIGDSDIIRIILQLMQRTHYEEMVRIPLHSLGTKNTPLFSEQPVFIHYCYNEEAIIAKKIDDIKRFRYECIICHNPASYFALGTDIIFCGKDCQSIYYELFRDIYKPLI
jgi:hypothetical protein